MQNILLLSGTSLAKDLIALAPDLNITASLAGVTRTPKTLQAPTRTGGFGGVEGLKNYLIKHKITHVVDATHPFATQITDNAVRACNALNIPLLVLQRPPWSPEQGDVWHSIENVEDALNFIPENTHVFLGTGRQTLPQFANFTNRFLTCRVIDPPKTPFPFPSGKFLQGRPPFSLQEEIDLFKAEKVDWLVVKNAGGAASRSKLDAARHLAIPVAMIERQLLPDVAQVFKAADALTWLKTR